MFEGVLLILSCGEGEDISHVQGYKYCPWGGGGGGKNHISHVQGGAINLVMGGGGGGMMSREGPEE